MTTSTPQSAHVLEAAPVLLQGGADYFPAIIEAMDRAQSWVQLETYVFDFNGDGADVAQALIRAAQRGVRVEVLVDGFGSSDLPDEWRQKIAASGMQWCVYSPLAAAGVGGLGLLFPNRWRRLHRKLCVIDRHVAFCGGINVLDDLFDPNHGDLQAPRFDFAVCITGALALEAAEAMALLWWRVQAGYSARQKHLVEAWQKFKAAGYGRRTDAKGLFAEKGGASGNRPGNRLGNDAHDISAGGAMATGATTTGMTATTTARAALVLRDNLRNRNSIEKVYRKAIGNARHDILIANAYFLPGAKLRKALIQAAKRGVAVTLLLQGRYEYFMQYHASRPVYGALLAAGIQIHEYEASFLHAKVAVIDGQWATIGSSNLDPLSLLLAREANVVVHDTVFAGELKARLQAAIAEHGRLLDPAAYSRRPLRQRMLDHIAYAAMRLAIFVTGQRY